MPHLKWKLCLLTVAVATSIATHLPAEPLEHVLWPGAAPGLADGETQEIVVNQDERIGQRVTKVTKPILTVYKPTKEKDTGAAVLICPGGGYHILALDLEGVEVAKWLNSIGVTGIVLQYRVPRSKSEEKHQGPLQDAQRALRICRHNAKSWGIDPQRIGILGFSAGGHLSAATATNFDKPAYGAIDDVDQESCRPDFTVLVYPAYLTTENESVELAPEIRVNAKTPPTLLIHAGNDRISAVNSIAFYLALKHNNVPGEIHIFPTGGHGYGLRPTEHAVTGWPKIAESWLEVRGLLTSPE